MPRADRIKLVLLMGLFAAPGLAAWLVHDHWRPTASASYGELLEPFQPHWAGAVDVSGPAVGKEEGLATLRGRWVLLTVAGARCDAACERHIYLTRQVRTAQGREQSRVERVLLQPVGADVIDDQGLRHFTVSAEALAVLPVGGPVRTFVMDPLGRVMLRFPAEPDGKGMIRDLGRLLKASGIG
jgi:hypothetical protein